MYVVDQICLQECVILLSSMTSNPTTVIECHPTHDAFIYNVQYMVQCKLVYLTTNGHQHLVVSMGAHINGFLNKKNTNFAVIQAKVTVIMRWSY